VNISRRVTPKTKINGKRNFKFEVCGPVSLEHTGRKKTFISAPKSHVYPDCNAI
jgi:hypothetical protein